MIDDGRGYGHESKAFLVGVFVASTLIGVGLAYAMVPEGLSTGRAMLGGGALGFHAALYPYANRYLMM